LNRRPAFQWFWLFRLATFATATTTAAAAHSAAAPAHAAAKTTESASTAVPLAGRMFHLWRFDAESDLRTWFRLDCVR
jgi:hypothetical protein